MTSQTDWSSSQNPPEVVTPARRRWERRDLVIAIIIFLLAAPLLIVSFASIIPNAMTLAGLSDSTVSQNTTALETIGMIALLVVTALYPVAFLFSLIETFRLKKLSWRTWVVAIGALPMIAIVIWVLL